MPSPRDRRVRLVLLAMALLLWPQLLTPSEVRPATSAVARLLGPVARLASGMQWVRVHLAERQGRPALALARAERALELDPGATGGWLHLARYQAYDLAALGEGDEPSLRADWLRAALATLERGEDLARQPEELAVDAGLILVAHAQHEQPTPWAGGRLGLWQAAIEAFERAAGLGAPDGAQLAEAARARRAELLAGPDD